MRNSDTQLSMLTTHLASIVVIYIMNSLFNYTPSVIIPVGSCPCTDLIPTLLRKGWSLLHISSHRHYDMYTSLSTNLKEILHRLWISSSTPTPTTSLRLMVPIHPDFGHPTILTHLTTGQKCVPLIYSVQWHKKYLKNIYG